MATKAQAKAAIDSAIVAIKADIDNILPAGVNIKDGSISFGPTRYSIIIDADGISGTALTWLTSITSALTTAGVVYTADRGDRRKEDLSSKTITITTSKMVIRIINF